MAHMPPPRPGPGGPGFPGMEHQFGAMNLNGGGGAGRPANHMAAHKPPLRGYRLSRATPSKGEMATWKRVIKNPWSLPDSELEDQVRGLQRGGSVTKRYQALSPNQQHQVDRLIEEETREERDQRCEWVIGYLMSDKKVARSAFGFEVVRPQTEVLYVILKRQERGHGGAGAGRRANSGQIVDLDAPRDGGMKGHGPAPHMGPHNPMAPHNFGGPPDMRSMPPPPMPQHPMPPPPPQPQQARNPGGYRGADPNVVVIPNGPPRPGHGGPPPPPPPAPSGPPGMARGPPGMARGPPGMARGPPGMARGPPGMAHGPPPPGPRGPGPQIPPPPIGRIDVGGMPGRRPSGHFQKPKIHRAGPMMNDDSSDESSCSDRDTDSNSDETDPSSYTSNASSPTGFHRRSSYAHVKPTGHRRSGSRGSHYREHRRFGVDEFDNSPGRRGDIHRRNSFSQGGPFMPRPGDHEIYDDHLRRPHPVRRGTYGGPPASIMPDLGYSDDFLAASLEKDQARKAYVLAKLERLQAQQELQEHQYRNGPGFHVPGVIRHPSLVYPPPWP